MRWNAFVVLWLCAASSALVGCASSSASRYAMSPSSMASVAPPSPSMAEAAPASPGSVEEGASTATTSGSSSADSDESANRSREAPAPAQPPARAMPGITRPPSVSRGPAGNTGGQGPAGNNGAPQNPAPQPAAQVPAPMLVYTADIDLQTERDRVVATIDRVIETATGMGGYLLRRTDNSVQVRIPSARFRESLRAVEDFGEVVHRSVAAQDVSEEYRDLEVRLQNLRAVRRRLEEFLARAGSMTDALQVERELERVTREIDTIEGRLRFLSTRVSFSLVTVNVRPRPEVSIAAGPPIPPRRAIDLPVEWFRRIGLERLLDTRE